MKESYPITHIPVSKAMELLGFSKYKFYGLVNEGVLDIKKVGKKSFVSIAQINNLFQEA